MTPIGGLLLSAACAALVACGGETAVETSFETPVEAAPRAVGIAVPADAQEATVVRHTDGDTLVLRGRGVGPLAGGIDTKVRLLLVDTPELRPTPECGAREATAALVALTPKGSTVRVADDRQRLDRFGRTLLHLWTADGVEVGEVLLREGLATVLVVRPNTRYLEAYEAAEAAAEQSGRGSWASCSDF